MVTHSKVVSERRTIGPGGCGLHNSCNWDCRYLLKKLKYLGDFYDSDWCALYHYHFLLHSPCPWITLLTRCLDFQNFIYSATDPYFTTPTTDISIRVQVIMWTRPLGDHLTIYTNVDSWDCTPETDIMLHVTYTTIKESSVEMLRN